MEVRGSNGAFYKVGAAPRRPGRPAGVGGEGASVRARGAGLAAGLVLLVRRESGQRRRPGPGDGAALGVKVCEGRRGGGARGWGDGPGAQVR